MSIHITVELRADNILPGGVIDLGARQVTFETADATVVIDIMLVRKALADYITEAERREALLKR